MSRQSSRVMASESGQSDGADRDVQTGVTNVPTQASTTARDVGDDVVLTEKEKKKGKER